MKRLHFAALLALAIAGSLLAAEIAKTPAGKIERVPFPKDYATLFQEIRAANKPAQTLVGTIYVNAPAASVRELSQLPYPDGSVFVMEWAQPAKGANGELLVDASGNWKKGPVTRVDVMRRQTGYGAAYGAKRAGEWEFASYRADGSAFTPAPDFAACAECHAKAAEHDFVFRGRFSAIAQK